jgi:hypothetical protein
MKNEIHTAEMAGAPAAQSAVPTVLALGNSHIGALQIALAGRQTQSMKSDHNFDVRRIYSPNESDPEGGVSMADALNLAERLGPADLVALSVAGTCHNIMGLLQHDTPFDLLAPDMASEATLVPFHVMYDQMLDHSRARRNILRFKQLTRARVCHLATPPPKEDEDYIRAKMMRYRGIALANAVLNPAPARLRLWQIEMDALRQACTEWGVDFVPAPGEARTSKGYLKPEFYGTDATHANAAYGALVLDQLGSLVVAESSRKGNAS